MPKLTKEQLRNLSTEEKLNLIDILDEKERRERLKRDSYTPNSGQAPVHRSKKQIRAVFSGNGAGKTCMGANEAKWGSEGYNPILDEYTPSPSRGIIVLDNPDKVSDVWLPEMQKWMFIDEEKECEKRGKPYYTRIRRENGSEILFMFHDQSPMRFESIEADWIIFDEPPPRKVYVALMRGLRKLGSKPWILFLGTPITAAWMRRKIYEPWFKGEAPHIECFRFDSDVNKANLNWEFMENVYFKSLSEKEIQIRRHGQFFDLEGLALAHLFDEDIHVVDDFDWPNSNAVVVIVDPHPSKNHVAVVLGADRDGFLYVIKEMSSASSPERFSQELLEFYAGFRVVDIVVDSLGNTPRTGGDGNKSFIQKLNEKHPYARGTTYQEKNDEEFIENLREVLEIPEKKDNFGRKIPKLRFFRSCRKSIYDTQNVEWQKNKEGESKDKLNISSKDFLACIKYGLATPISFSSNKPRTLRSKRRSPWASGSKNMVNY